VNPKREDGDNDDDDDNGSSVELRAKAPVVVNGRELSSRPDWPK
jgi:hypothetical protein